MSRRKFLRSSRTSGSTRALVDRIIAAGWRPGLRLRNLPPRGKRKDAPSG